MGCDASPEIISNLKSNSLPNPNLTTFERGSENKSKNIEKNEKQKEEQNKSKKEEEIKPQKIEEIKPLKEEEIRQQKVEQNKPKKEEHKSLEKELEKDNIIMNLTKKINFKELFMENLTPGFLKLFKDNSNLYYSQSFLEGICYEYGLMDKSENKKNAFNAYKDGADKKNDYLCMFRLYSIYLNDYKDFDLKEDLNLSKLYLFKCFAYLPFTIINGNYFILNKINISYEIADYLDNNDQNFSNFNNFMSNLEENNQDYNLTKNDIKLMKTVFSAYFDSSLYKYNSDNLNEFLNFEKDDTAYHEARLKFCNFYLEYYGSICDKKKVEEIYDSLIKNKYYKAAYDYGKYLVDQQKIDEAKKIFKIGMDNSQQFCLSAYLYLTLGEKEIGTIISDYEVTSDILKNMFLSVCFEKLNLSSTFYAINYLIKHSSFKTQIEDAFINLILEIYKNLEKNIGNNNYIQTNLSERYIIEFPFIFGQICYYGVSGHITPNKEKALNYFKRSYNLAKEKEYEYFKKMNYLYIYKCRQYLFKSQKITEEKMNKTKKKFIKLYCNSIKSNSNAFEIYNVYKLYKDGSIKGPKNKMINLLILFNNINIIFNFKDYVYREKSKIKLKEYDNYCVLCYENKNGVILKPCEHQICESCTSKLKEKKCPLCGSDYKSFDKIN